jgi:hypothetical protein
MTLRHRLRRLEAGLRKDGRRCPLCRDRPGQVMVTMAGIGLPDDDRGDRQPCTDEREEDSAETAAPCPACGWQPEVVQVTEVVVYSRAQWAAGEFRTLAQEGVP